MKALTLRQPYAGLIALGVKRIETRSWGTPYRGFMRNMPDHQAQVNAFLTFRSALEKLVGTKDGQG